MIAFATFRVRMVLAALVLGLSLQTASAQEILLGPDNGTVRALVIGIDAYRYVRPLKGAVADALDIDGSLRRMGVHDVTRMIDDQVDRASVLKQIDSLLARTHAGDFVIITIAGHGAQEPERVRGSQPDGLDKVFLLSGFNPKTAAGGREKILGEEFNHLIRQFEARGARVMFVADTCYAGGLSREVDPRAAQMSYRQIPRYVLAVDDLKPISTTADSYLTDLDFDRTEFLAAVDRYTKAPEVHIPGIPGLRGALSYAVARAVEGRADSNGDGKVTLKELFSNVRQVVYQLSDERQSPVTLTSPSRKLDQDVAFRITRSIKLIGGVPEAVKPASVAAATPVAITPDVAAPEATSPVPVIAKPTAAKIAPVRIASLDGHAGALSAIEQREAPFTVVSLRDNPDLLWDPQSRDVLAGGDVIAYGADQAALPSIIDRAAAVRAFKMMATKSPQTVRIRPNDKLQHTGARIKIEVGDVADRSMVMFNIAGDGTVQALYPIKSDPEIIRTASYKFPVEVREPYGADQIVVITSKHRMGALEQVLRQLDRRRSPMQMLRMVERYGPPDARIGSIGLFTAR